MKPNISIFNFNWRRFSTLTLIMIVAISVIFLLRTPLNIQTNMLSLLPNERINPSKEAAFQHASREASQKIIILIGSPIRSESYTIANNFFGRISDVPFIEQKTFRVTSDSKESLIRLVSLHQNQLLSNDYRQLLINKNSTEIAKKAQQDLSSPFGFRFSSIGDDPFFLSKNFITNLGLMQNALFPYKDVLMVEHNQRYYVFLALTIAADKVFSTNEINDVVNKIYDAKKLTENQFSNAEIILSGVPIHSHAGSKQGMQEANLIGWISLVGVLLLAFITFRSLKPFYFITASIALGFVVALAVTHLVFGEVHMLTIIFGSSLVGVSDDYSLHFFCEYLNRKKADQKNGMEVLKHIYPGITLGLITSVFGYMSLIFTPFPGLQQIALFSTIGFTTSFLIVILFFPKFYLPIKLSYRSSLLNIADKFLLIFQRNFSPRKAYFCFGILALVSIFGISKIKAFDDIRLLYSSPKHLINNEILTRKILRQDRAVQFFLVEDEDEQKLLEKEEHLTTKLRQLLAKESLKSFQAITQIIPSQERQQQNFSLIKHELFAKNLDQQAKIFGLKNDQIKKLKHDLDSPLNSLTIDEAKNSGLGDIIKPFLIENMPSGKQGTIITLESVKDVNALKNLEDSARGIYLINKVEEISNTFREYRQIAILLLIIVNIAIAILLIWRHKLKKAVFVFLPPALASSLTMAIFGFSGHAVNLFDILALFLVMGVGVDYAIFYAEDKETLPTTSLAIVLSSSTTIMSFGLLALSSFNAIHSIGLTILLGILLSYLLSPFSSLIHHKKS